MNKEELIKEYDEKAKALRDEFISKLEKVDKEEKKPFLVELPEDGERLYFIDNVQSTISSKIFDINNMNDVKRFENGLFFETKEEAEQHLKESKLLFKLKHWAKRKNEGWGPDWKNIGQSKHYIEIDMDTKEFTAWYTSYTSRFTKLPYFKSQETAQACIDEFGEEIKEVFS